MAFFKPKKGKPNELVKNTRQLLLGLKKGGPKNVEDLAKNLQQIKSVFTVDEHEPNQEIIKSLIEEMFAQELIPLLVTNLGRLDFESKKDTASIFNTLLRRSQTDKSSSCVDYLATNPQVLVQMVSGCNDKDTALNFGVMLRECIRSEPLTKILLQDENFYVFFTLVESPNFDVASDAFTTFKELLTKHKPLVAEFLEKNYEKFFEDYTQLLHSPNYVTKRQSLKLLGELLLDRSNFNVMTKYISQRSNLKLMMTLLRDKSRSIQFEAFHVFKVFVANPNKPEPILEILVKNKDKLIVYLREFHNDKDDEQFTDEKGYLIKQIEAL